MPINQEIIPLLDSLVTNYKQTSTSRSFIYLKSGVDPNYQTIFDALFQLPEIIKNSPLDFNNETLYDYTLKLFGKYEETDPHFVTHWRIFNKSYHAIIQQHLSTASTASGTGSSEYTIGTGQDLPTINIRPEGEPDGFTRDLMQALTASQQSLKSTQKAHTSEVALLNRKLAEAQRSSLHLAAQNETLKEQIKFEQTLRRLQPEFDITREQLLRTAELFQALADLSRKKPELIPPVDSASLTTLAQEQSHNAPTCSNNTQTATQKISTSKQPIPGINLTLIPTAPASSSTLNTVPPPAPPAPPAPPVSSEPIEKQTSPAKNKGPIPPAKQRFFSLGDELNSRLQGAGSSEASLKANSAKRLEALANFQKKN